MSEFGKEWEIRGRGGHGWRGAWCVVLPPPLSHPVAWGRQELGVLGDPQVPSASEAFPTSVLIGLFVLHGTTVRWRDTCRDKGPQYFSSGWKTFPGSISPEMASGGAFSEAVHA